MSEFEELPPEELKEKIKEAEETLKKMKQAYRAKRGRKELTPEEQAELERLLAERDELKVRLKEINARIRELQPRRRSYDFRGSPLYELVKTIIEENTSDGSWMTYEDLAEALKEHGKGVTADGRLTGTVGVILRNLADDGLIERERGRFRWATSTSQQE